MLINFYLHSMTIKQFLFLVCLKDQAKVLNEDEVQRDCTFQAFKCVLFEFKDC